MHTRSSMARELFGNSAKLRKTNFLCFGYLQKPVSSVMASLARHQRHALSIFVEFCKTRVCESVYGTIADTSLINFCVVFLF